jgi:hypothetical protein
MQARRAMMIQCYTRAVISNTSPSSCTGDFLSDAQKQAAAPLPVYRRPDAYTDHDWGSRCTYRDGVSTGFHHVVPIWAPSASTSIPL